MKTRQTLLVACALCLVACGGKDGLVLVGGDMSSAIDGGVQQDAGVCPDPATAEGTACSVEGQSCGQCSDPCQFCNLLRCQSGKWTHLEAFPANCNDAGMPLVCHLGNDPLPCSDSSDCAAAGAVCAGSGPGSMCVCSPMICTPGADQTCNDNPAMSSLAGSCNSSGSCQCGSNAKFNPQTGKCIALVCPVTAPANNSPCADAGQTCSYLPNTTCTCYNGTASTAWSCAF